MKKEDFVICWTPSVKVANIIYDENGDIKNLELTSKLEDALIISDYKVCKDIIFQIKVFMGMPFAMWNVGDLDE